MSPSPRLWVLTECYPRPGALRRCPFIHPQMLGVKDAGWNIDVLVPNGWFPSVAWPIAPAWRAAHAARIPRGWSLDGISVQDLTYQNRVPSRLCRPRDARSRIVAALARRLASGEANPNRDLLLAQFALPYGPVVRQAAKALGLRYVVHLRGDDVWVHPHRDAAKRLNSFLETLRDADLVLSVSRSLIEEAQRLSGQTLSAAVVPNGIDLGGYRPPQSPQERERLRNTLGIRPTENVIICVGDALLRKGWIELLDALGGLPESVEPIRLLAVVGLTGAELDLPAEASQRAPRIRLSLLRGLPPERLACVYRATDVFCLLSHWEGLSNAVLEAMASGLPVVTSDVAGHPEVITHGVDGFLVPAKAAALARPVLLSLLRSSAMRAAVGSAARRRAESVGDPGKAGKRLASLLDGVLRGSPDGPLLNASPYAPEKGPIGLAGTTPLQREEGGGGLESREPDDFQGSQEPGVVASRPL